MIPISNPETHIEILSSIDVNLDKMKFEKPLSIFAPQIISFIRDLSSMLIKDRETRNYPDVLAFSMWCRALTDKHLESQSNIGLPRLGRGLAFHITPNNVPINFAYSLVAGLVTGNINIVKLPSKRFAEVDFLVSKIRQLSREKVHANTVSRFALIRYARQKDITDKLSAMCDFRVIWGGDSTISEIRNSPIKARAFDINFSNRFSLCIIDAEAYLSSNEKMKVAQAFYTDTYLFDQNACTAPHLVVWRGDPKLCDEAKIEFWENLSQLVSIRYTIEPVQIIDKLVASTKAAALFEGCKIHSSEDKKIIRVNLTGVEIGLEELISHSGFFYEFNVSKLGDITNIITDKYQTLSYFGFEREIFVQFVEENLPRGIDRIVPIGKTLDFDFCWDGYDLIQVMTRGITVR